ncbi:MAG TPA: DUF4856 domain-containing protein [Ferruginibacter sp.]|nr:DUF4856 domain-containing protein [Ferruginibacter sp.]
MKKITISFCILLAAISFSSCKKSSHSNPTNTDTTINYTVPTTYNFTHVNDTAQLELIAMADQIVAAINLGNVVGGTVVSTQQLTDMFNNVNDRFNDSVYNLNGSGVSLANNCPAAAKTDILNYFDSIGVYSQSTAVADSGVAGVGVSLANKKLLLSPTGIFYSQVVKKTIMGVFSYQIANAYMADSINSTVDTVVLARYWDAAFGYFGVPVNFPTNLTGLKYLGSYCNQVNAGLNSNASIMNAFLKGRAAISNNDIATMKIQAGILIATFDSLDAAAIVQEMHETNTNINAGDAVAAYGTLSESIGFVRNLKYNTSATRVISNTQFAQLEALYDNVNPGNPNLYSFVGVNAGLTTTQIEAKTAAIEQFIDNVYGFSSTESPLL